MWGSSAHWVGAGRSSRFWIGTCQLVIYKLQCFPVIELIQSETFRKWLTDLSDMRARVRIQARLDRLALGNAGDAQRSVKASASYASITDPAIAFISNVLAR